MKVWQKIAQQNNLKNKEDVRATFNSNCPADVESLHNYIGEKRLKEFCNNGCSVICTDEYLYLNIKEVDK